MSESSTNNVTDDTGHTFLSRMALPRKNNVGRNSFLMVRFRYLFLGIIFIVVSFFMFSISNRSDVFLLNSNVLALSLKSEQHQSDDYLKLADFFTIKTNGCTIPGLDPYDETIKQYIHPVKRFGPCHRVNSPLADNNKTHIWTLRNNLGSYRLPVNANVTCCLRSLSRPVAIPDIPSKDVDDRVTYGPCIDAEVFEVKDEFVKIECSFYRTILYDQYYAYPQANPFSVDEDSSGPTRNETSYNVIVLGIDAVSRLNFIRTMPKTYSFLKDKGAIELKGYNKVGDNTFPNVVAMLLGLKDTELKTTCWPNEGVTFDHCPFLWQRYKDAGYETAFGEDTASLGTFNFEKMGFGRTPTDHYLRTLIREAEKYTGNNKDFNSFICMGHHFFYKVLLDYIEDLCTTPRSKKLFGFFWEMTMSHDYLNYPSATDGEFEAFFQHLDSSHYLDNTVFILLSDHGMRWGDIRYTKQGRIEERLPLNYILMPPSFKKNFPLAHANLLVNSERLTSPFDIYETLSDLADMNRLKNDVLSMRTNTSYAHNRSISLFLPIPTNRTCETTGIDRHWCTCHRGNRIGTTSVEASNAANFLVRHLNSLVESYDNCAPIRLKKILDVSEMIVGVPIANEDGWREFLVTILTSPGEARFEATLRYDGQNWLISGTISRLNIYADQGWCMHLYYLKMFCFCY